MSSHEDTLLQNRRLRIFSLILSITIILSLLTILVLILTKKETVRYVEFSTKGDYGFKVLESNEISNTQKELIVVNQLKKYISSRVENLGGKKYNKGEIDIMKSNYVKAFSSQSVYRQYQAEFARIYETAEFYKRDVNIISAIQQEENKYLFSFNTLDYYEGEEEPIINRFGVYVKFSYVPIENIPSHLRKINPLAVQITWYRDDQETNNKNSNSYNDE